jgi:hypothetical protein
MVHVHVEERVRCIDCNKVYCMYCEDRCTSCHGIHISSARPSLNYSLKNPAEPIHALENKPF